MKVLYYSGIGFSDVDISLLQELQKKEDIYWCIPIYPHRLKGAAINIEKLYPKSGVFRAVDIYPVAFEKFKNVIDLNKVYVVNNCGKRGFSIKTWLTQVRFYCFLLKKQFDVIHITWSLYYFTWWMFVFRKKIVMTVHDPFPHSSMNKNKLFILERKLSFRLLRNFIVLNRKQKDEFVKHYHLEKKHVFESRLGVYSYLGMYDNLQRPLQEKYILFFGQIQSHKGLDLLLPAMVELHKYNEYVHLIVAGKGNFSFDLEVYRSLHYIHFYNRFIPDDELAALIKYSEFVVCPYKDATQSGVVMSAFAFCKPVLATNVGALPEMVENNKFGKIVQPLDKDGLVSAMLEMLNSPLTLQEYEQNIERKYMTGEMSWKYIASGLSVIYARVAGLN